MKINRCPGTLNEDSDTYNRTCLLRVFDGRMVSHTLPWTSPGSIEADDQFEANQRRIALPGVQQKFSVLLDGNEIRLTRDGERGTHILKPIPNYGKRRDQMPANEHLTMQIAHQEFGIDTAENALMFFSNGTPAYITKRFDRNLDGSEKATEDFAALAGKTAQTHGEDYKYQGSYMELFQIMAKFLPAHKLETPKLFKLLIFNYLFSNGDAHFKNFSIIETSMGDYKLSPAYDLLNTRIHVDDTDFALDEGLIPRELAQTNIAGQLRNFSQWVGLKSSTAQEIMTHMLSSSDRVMELTERSFLPVSSQRRYIQDYNYRLKQLKKGTTSW